jgi:hypothetical protein
MPNGTCINLTFTSAEKMTRVLLAFWNLVISKLNFTEYSTVSSFLLHGFWL